MDTSLAGDVLTTDGSSGIHTPRVSTPKGTPEEATFTTERKKADVEGYRCKKAF